VGSGSPARPHVRQSETEFPGLLAYDFSECASWTAALARRIGLRRFRSERSWTAVAELLEDFVV
jgi:hypothetical protein